jgi:hypothetical protein
VCFVEHRIERIHDGFRVVGRSVRRRHERQRKLRGGRIGLLWLERRKFQRRGELEQLFGGSLELRQLFRGRLDVRFEHGELGSKFLGRREHLRWLRFLFLRQQ